MSVDLPAPFSPQSATTSPALTWMLTLSNATTPGKRLPIPRISSRGEVLMPAFARCASILGRSKPLVRLCDVRPHPGLLPQEKENRFQSHSQTKRWIGGVVSIRHFPSNFFKLAENSATLSFLILSVGTI